ncbi:MAG: autoinducer binding domain-containing protein [Bdellovibrionales bacterium]
MIIQDGSLPERIERFIHSIDASSTLDQVFSALVENITALGFERFAYALLWLPEGSRSPFCITNYPDDWADHYRNENMISDDYIGRQLAKTNVPFLWADLIKGQTLTQRQRMVFCEGSEAGLRSGATVPIHGPLAAKAIFSVANRMSDDEFSKLFKSYRHELHLIATYAHEKVISLGISKPISTTIELTPRELEVLTWMARGKSRWETGMILQAAESTIKTHLENARVKLDASNTTHAIAKSLIHGLITP